MDMEDNNLFSNREGSKEQETGCNLTLIDNSNTSKRIEAVAIVDESGIEKTKGQLILNAFSSFFDFMASMEYEVKKINRENPSKDDSKKAKAVRLKIKDNRCEAEKKKDELKKGIILEGRVIDGIFKTVESTSKILENECDEIEKFEARQEEKRKKALTLERIEAFNKYNFDASFLNLADMPQENFDKMLESARLAYEKKIEDEAKAAREREKIDSRIKIISSIGLTWSQSELSFLLGDINISMVEIRCDDESVFNAKIESIKTEIQRRADEAEKERKRLSKINESNSVMFKAGFIIDGDVFVYRMKSEETAISYKTNDIYDMSDLDLNHEIETAKIKIAKDKERFDEIENARIAKQNLGVARDRALIAIGCTEYNAEQLSEMEDGEYIAIFDKANKVYLDTKAEEEAKAKRLKDLEEQELKRKADEKKQKAEERKNALAPDKDKLAKFIALFEAITAPSLKDEKAVKIASDALGLRDKIVAHVKKEMEGLQ